MRLVLTILGAGALAMGLLWIGQGIGLVYWPRSSFMLDQRHGRGAADCWRCWAWD